MKLTLKESIVLAEARDQKLKYTEKQVKGAIDRVIVALEKQKSSAMTKIAERYFKLDLAVKKLSEERDKLNKEMKETTQGLFDATDVVYTRVVETCSFTMTLAKQMQTEPVEKIDYDFQKVAEDLAKLIPDELQAKVDEIMEAHKKVTMVQPRSPAFTVKPKMKESLEESLASAIGNIGKIVSSLVKKITGWAIAYDKKLAQLKKASGIVNESIVLEDDNASDVGDILKASVYKADPNCTVTFNDDTEEYEVSHKQTAEYVDEKVVDEVMADLPRLAKGEYNGNRETFTVKFLCGSKPETFTINVETGKIITK